MKLHKLVLPCLMALLAPALAQASDFGNLALAGIYGYGGACNNRAGVINNFTPPYFSLHPPVYYGDRFYRPYGESPYASWPQLQPNAAYSPRLQARAEQVAIPNPHYAPQAPGYPSDVQPNVQPHAEPAKAKNPDVVQSSVGPLTIPNPYFTEPKQYISKH
jgi:hypothetical protein